MRRAINFLFNLGTDIESKKLSIAFLLDLSGSMQGEPLEKVKLALSNILQPLVKFNSNPLSKDKIPSANQVLLMTFETEVQKVCPWVDEENFDFFRECLFAVPEMIFRKTGATALYDGLFEILNEVYNNSKQANEKIIVIFSDGDEYNSKKKKSEVIDLYNKYKNGFVKKDEVNSILQSYDLQKFNKIFINLNADELIFSDTFSSGDLDFISDENHKKILLDLHAKSKSKIKIISLHYSNEGASEKGKELLEEFAQLSEGKVFYSTNVDSIPSVLDELIINLLYEESSGIRSKLIRRLDNSYYTNSENGDKDWFRVISINTLFGNEKKLKIVSNSLHTLFSIDDSSLVKEVESREAYFRFVKNTLEDQKGINIKDTLINNFTNQNKSLNSTQIDSYVFVWSRGNDILGSSASDYLKRIIEEINNEKANQLLGRNLNFILVLLLDKFISYTDEEKKRLYGILIESSLPESFDAVILISDRNDSTTNENYGFKSLRLNEFEDLAVETIVGLNLNQNLLDNIFINGNDNKFYNIGSLSLFLDVEKFIDKSSRRFLLDFLNNLYDNKEFQTYHEDVVNSLDQFFNEINFKSLKHYFLETMHDRNLYQQIDCPGIWKGAFIPYKSEVILEYYSKMPSTPVLLTKKITYLNEIEYIRYLLFDVKEYLDSCHAVELFKAEIEKRSLKILENITIRLKELTDNKLFGNNDYASPLQAELWIEELYKRICNYIDEGMKNDLNLDQDYKELQSFKFETYGGAVITDSNVENAFLQLKNKLENFPLPSSVRFKYHSLSLLTLTGILSFILNWSLPIGYFIFLLVPASLSIWGEYKIKQVFKQLNVIIQWYAAAHRFKARKESYSFLIDSINDLFTKLKNKIKRERENNQVEPFHIENYSENELLQIFKDSLTNSVSKYYKSDVDSTGDQSVFNVSMTESVDLFGNNTTILNGPFSTGYPNKDASVRWNDFYRNIISTDGDLQRNRLPYVEIGFLPCNIDKLPDNILLKILVQEIIKERKYKIILLTNLSEEETKELKSLYDNIMWSSAIDDLVNRYVEIKEDYTGNIFSLWRNVVYYQIWLDQIKEIVFRQRKNSEIKTDLLFNIWIQMYDSRRNFRRLLGNFSFKYWEERIKNNAQLWKLMSESGNYKTILNYIIGYSFPSFYQYFEGNEHPPYLKFYLASENNSTGNILRNYKVDFNVIFPANRWNYISINEDNFKIYFTTISQVTVNNSDIFKNLDALFPKSGFKNSTDDEWRKYILDNFANTSFESKKYRKEFSFPYNN